MQKRTDFFDNSLLSIVPDIPLVIRNKPHNNQLCTDLFRFISAYPVVSHFLRFAWQTTPWHTLVCLRFFRTIWRKIWLRTWRTIFVRYCLKLPPEITKKIKISAPVYTFCEVFDHIAINNFLVLLVCVIYKIDINQCIIHKWFCLILSFYPLTNFI